MFDFTFDLIDELEPIRFTLMVEESVISFNIEEEPVMTFEIEFSDDLQPFPIKPLYDRIFGVGHPN